MFTPLEKVHPVRNKFLTGQADEVGGRIPSRADGGLMPPSAAITPQGELKPCLMINEPRYAILGRQERIEQREQKNEKTEKLKNKKMQDREYPALKTAWESLKDFMSSIKLDEHYHCNSCGLEAYCKWCPAKSWLYNQSFTSCDPQSRQFAKNKAKIWNQKLS